MAKMKIRFTQDYRPKYGDGPVFKQGAVEEMTTDSAERYIKRKVAEEVTVETRKADESKTKRGGRKGFGSRKKK